MDKYKRLILRWQEKISEINPLKRQIRFNYEYLKLNKIITFVWPRRAGKTYFMFFTLKKLIKEKKIDKKQIVFIDFTAFLYDDFSVEKLLENFFELYPNKKPFFVFDEIQELINFKKIVIYLFNEWYKLFLSGSNSKLLSSEISTVFRWRTIDIRVHTLKFMEFLYFRDIKIDNTYTEKQLALLSNTISEFLNFWSYPEIVLSKNNETKYELIKWYFNLLLYKDLLEKYSIENEYAIKYLIKKLLLGITKEFNINKIFNELKSQNLKIWKQTIYNYIEYLKEIFFIKEFLDKYKKWSKKFFFYDLWYNNILLLENLWQRFENAVWNELNKKFDDVSYMKNKDYEIDFIVLDKNIWVQVCYDLNIENLDRETKWLLACNFSHKYLVYYKTETYFEVKWLKIVNFLEFLNNIQEF